MARSRMFRPFILSRLPKSMLSVVLNLLAAALLLLYSSANAAGQAGRPAYGAMDDHAYDSINLQNLNVLVHAPIFQKAGAMPVSVAFYANSYCIGNTGTWQCGAQSPTVTNFGAITANNFLGGPTNTGWATAYPLVQTTGGCTKPGYIQNVFSQWVIREANGTLHPLNPLDTITTGGDATYCIHTPLTDTTIDGSGLTVTLGSTSGGYYVSPVISSGGVTINGLYPTATSITDPNNNVVSTTTTQYKDTLGLFAATASPNVNAPTSVSWTDVNSGSPAVNVTESNVAWQTNFGCPGINDVPAGSSQPQFSGLSFPDGSSLSVTYEASTSGHVTGRIGSMVLPTGGTVSYAYTMSCTGWVTKLVRTTSDGTTTYSSTQNNGGPGHGSITTVTDQGGNVTSYQFSNPNAYYQTVLISKTVKLGGSSTLSTTVYCYNNNTANCGSASTTVSLPITQMTVQTTVGSQTRQSAYTYDKYGNTLTDAEYDFGASSPTTTTTTVYGTWNGSNCVAVSSTINNRPCTVTTVYVSNQIYKAEYTYDGSGNLTSKSVWTGTQWLTSTATYNNSNGTVATSHDAANNLTSYYYNGTGGCNGVFPTSVVSGGLTTSYTWYCNGGVVHTSTDPNGKVTTYGYQNSGGTADPFWRLSSVTDPLGNEAWKSYTPTSLNSSFTFDSSINNTTVTTDGYGRTINVQRQQGPSATTYDTVSTSYTWGGTNNNKRLISTNVPCTANLNATCSITNSIFIDPLGRTTWTSNPVTGEYVSTVYNQNDVLSTLGPAPTGENLKEVQKEYDGLGRLTSTCKISSTVGGSTSCLQKNGSYSGVLTTNVYTSTSGSQTVSSARGSQSRSKTFDGLGRVTSSTTPEAGTTTYLYDSGSTCGGSYPGHIVQKTFPTHYECYLYDSLGRLTDVGAGYSGGGTTLCKRFRFDNSQGVTGTLPSGIAPQNPYARMVEAETDNCTVPTTPITDEWFSYDTDGHMTDMWEMTPNSGQYYHSTATFAGNGVVTSLKFDNITPNETSTYGLDGEGRWNSLTTYGQTMVPSNGVTFNAAGQPTLINLGSGADNDTYTYDPSTGRMTNWQFTVGTKNESAVVNWNPNGTLNNVAITDGFNAGGTQTCYYNPSGSGMGYDDLGRLLSISCGTNGSIWNQTFSYDQYDNITKSSAGPGLTFNPGYDPSTNHYASSFGATYDNSGNITYDTFNYYAWDQFNKLQSVNINGTNCATNGECIVYDALGRAVQINSGGNSTEIWYTQLGKTAYMNGSTFKYAYWPTPGGGTILQSPGYSYYYEHKDWLGNARISSNLVTTIIDDRAFAPYGEIYDNFGSTAANENIFTGDTQDILGTGDCCFDTPNRELSANQGRWLSPDPAGAGWNAYAYATNPNSFVDPSGLFRQFYCNGCFMSWGGASFGGDAWGAGFNLGSGNGFNNNGGTVLADGTIATIGPIGPDYAGVWGGGFCTNGCSSSKDVSLYSGVGGWATYWTAPDGREFSVVFDGSNGNTTWFLGDFPYYILQDNGLGCDAYCLISGQPMSIGIVFPAAGLGELGDIFEGYAAGQGFTGVYDVSTGDFALTPSTYETPIPDGYVSANGGHADVSAELGGDSSGHYGFTAILQEDSSLQLTWKSGTLNPAPNYTVPAGVQQQVTQGLQQQTWRVVRP